MPKALAAALAFISQYLAHGMGLLAYGGDLGVDWLGLWLYQHMPMDVSWCHGGCTSLHSTDNELGCCMN